MGLAMTAEQATQRAQNFLSRFRLMTEGMREVISPVTGRAVRAPDWPQARSDEPSLLPRQAAPTVVRYGQRASSAPKNEAILYQVEAGRGGRESFVIAALAFAHIAAYARDGADAAPLSPADYAGITEAIEATASSRGAFVVVGVASCTRFEPAVEETVAGSASTRPLAAPNYAACLVDLSSGKLVHNPNDRRILPFLPLYRGELPEEAIERVITFVRGALLLRASQSLAEVMAATGASEPEAREAFRRLGTEPGYTVGTLKDVGLVISRRV